MPLGVYRGLVEVDGRPHEAVVNVGVRPTFGETTWPSRLISSISQAISMADGVRLDFLERLREEMRFPSVDELKAQIVRDVAAARARS